MEFIEWFFDGIGTFLIGIALGGTAGSVITYKVKWSIKNVQKNGKNSKGNTNGSYNGR